MLAAQQPGRRCPAVVLGQGALTGGAPEALQGTVEPLVASQPLCGLARKHAALACSASWGELAVEAGDANRVPAAGEDVARTAQVHVALVAGKVAKVEGAPGRSHKFFIEDELR